MWALAILALARLIRWPIVASGTRNTRAMSTVVKPQIVRNASATCDSGDSAGWQQVNSSRNRSSRLSLSSSSIADPSVRSRNASSSFGARRASRRSRSSALLRATVVSQAPGLSGTPSRRHESAATTTASCSASSARSMSPVRRMRVASTWPPSIRMISSSGSISSAHRSR